MNLAKLFEMQRKLDDHIMDEHPELKGQNNLDWKILTLQVELGECANEWRGFKKWSNDQEPRVHKKVECHACKGLGEFNHQVFHGYEHVDDKTEICPYCNGTGIQEECNPLLEEYVDCLHFILSIGNDLFGEFSDEKLREIISIAEVQEEHLNITSIFIVLNGYAADLSFKEDQSYNYEALLTIFLNIGKKLGFTWEQIEQAYFAKNAVNHERQENGY